eukprot:comp24308_c0_seq2/m.45677 comp24308_c0_seq2/g.45677  ORF comp24308_c0_seq2/g.45677 comp24308_c0_seq2/m.45677 type:complete len:181 (-) comp24308_c0_seq2:49-591(-)
MTKGVGSKASSKSTTNNGSRKSPRKASQGSSNAGSKGGSKVVVPGKGTGGTGLKAPKPQVKVRSKAEQNAQRIMQGIDTTPASYRPRKKDPPPEPDFGSNSSESDYAPGGSESEESEESEETTPKGDNKKSRPKKQGPPADDAVLSDPLRMTYYRVIHSERYVSVFVMCIMLLLCILWSW